MKLYLVRHGNAVDQSPDALRPLSETGIREVSRVAAVLAASGLRVERIWHSGRLRAEQTAALLAKQLRQRSGIERIAGIAPMDPVEEFSRDLDVWEEDTMVVGHQPFLGRLAAMLLCSTGNSEPLAFATGSVACLKRTADDGWVLQWMLHPKLCGGNKR
jgi:phosphohistidine phosphatase